MTIPAGAGDDRPANAAPVSETRTDGPRRQWRSAGALIAVGLVAIVVVVLDVRHRATSRQREAEQAMVETLGRLVTAQEGFFYDSVRYAPSLRSFPQLGPPAGVRLTIDSAGARTWWGTATHTALPGRRCVVWVGTAPGRLPAEVRVPESEGKPVCLDVTPRAAR